MPWTMTHGYKFTRESITRVPNQSGVLGLYNEEGWVFIESCSNLQEALSQYLDKSLESFWPDEPNGYTYEICDAVESEEKRDKLILEYYPGRNQLLDNNPAVRGQALDRTNALPNRL